ncbi:RNA-directed DNA polymerase, eukaryota [Tanacetum coccineum]
MLMTMKPDLQWNLETLAYDMLKELKTLFSQQAEQELLQTVREFHACKKEEGQFVSSYVLKIKRYIDNLERLGHPVSLNLSVSLILVSLRKEYDSFVQNYNMYGIGKTVNELDAMLKLHEQTVPKKDALHAIRAGKGSRKLKPGALSRYMGNGQRAAVKAIGSYDLCFPRYPKETMGYSLYYSPENKVFVAWNAEFFENSLITQKSSGSLEDLKIIQKEDTHPSENTSSHHDKGDQEIDEPQSDIIPIRRSTRIRHATNQMCLNIEVDESELGDLNEPANYKAILLDPESDKWLNAMNVEMQSMKDNKVWELVDLPHNGKTISSKWLFKKKTYMDGAVYMEQPEGFVNPKFPNRDVKSYLGRCFAMKDLGEAAYILGIKIYRDRSKRLIAHAECPYASAVGSIMYDVRCTRTDVAFAQNITSRFQQNPRSDIKQELKVSCYTDAGYLTDADDLKSQTGYVFVLNRGAVDWMSTKQSIFATSSAEAEYIAASDASKEVWTPNANIVKEDVCYIPDWVKFDDITIIAFTKDGLSAIKTKLDTPLMLDSSTAAMCMDSWGRSMRVFSHVLDEYNKKIVSDGLNNLKNPRQAVSGVSVGSKVGSKVHFKPTKQVYQPIAKKNGASANSKQKQARLTRQEVSNSNLFDALNTVENDYDLGTNGENSKLAQKGANFDVVSSSHRTSSKAFEAAKKVDDPVNVDSDSEVEEMFQAGYGEFNSFVSVLKRGSQLHVTPEITKPALVLDDTCIKKFDFGMSLTGRAKDMSAIPNLPCIISKEGFQNVKLSYLGGMWVLFEFDSLTTKEKFLNHSGIGSWFTELIQATSSFENDERIVWISIEGLPIKAWTPNTFRKIASLWGEYVEWEDDDLKSLSCKHLCLKTNMKVIINERQKVIIQGKVYWIRVKELDAWFPNFQEDDQDDLSSDGESQEGDVANKADNNESDVDRVSESSFMHENDTAHKDANICKKGEVGSHSEDPFNIYGILDGQKNNVCNSCSDEPKFPPGFTPDNNDHEKNVVENIKDTTERVQSLSNKLNDRCSNRGFSSQRSMNSHSQKSKVGGSILDLMDELVTVGQTMGYNMAGLGNKAKRRWIKELCQKHRINFASIQETKAESISLLTIKDLWGNQMFDHVVGSSVGCSGGILCMWNPNMFVKEQVSTCDYFVALMGTWAPTSSKLLIISVYAPQELNERRDLWDYLRTIIDRWEGDTVIMGDFNEVRSEHERFGSTFNRQGAIAFNNFISSACLIDLPLEGYAFTWAHKSASKMSKLDRYLISEGVLDLFPHLSALCLDRHLSDHRPILMRETNYDYGPSPFRFFHSWFAMEGFNSFVETTWKSLNIVEPNGLIRLKKKLQALKIAIKAWSKEANKRSNDRKINIQQNLSEVDKLIDQGKSNDEILIKRITLLNDLQELNNRNAMEISQKAKIRWSIEGDENSKYFHGIMNKKRSQLAIRGTLANGEWISEPHRVKNEFFTHFKKQFSPIQAPSICFDFTFPTRLSSDQVQDLERPVTYEEVKRAVWDCGTNKSPGPDGFSFEFYRKYWTTIDDDVFQAVRDFFVNGHFPRGCNSSFIALIPKIQDAKFVKDFRPISLIGSVYKIIAKILANRLCLVLPYLISDVQSAFVANRQILDGPFILNELLSWCKFKKLNGMIFKVDFEKAFDSVKWDYLDETLKAFGFGLKWRNWISSCLNNAMGSVLVNGSPTLEFQFHKGLKQGEGFAVEGSKSRVEQKIMVLLCSKVADLVLPIYQIMLKFPTRWLRVVPIKVNVHAWRVCLDKLPTRANLSLRGVDIPSIACPLCNSAVESTSHIFFACPLARQVEKF